MRNKKLPQIGMMNQGRFKKIQEFKEELQLFTGISPIYDFYEKQETNELFYLYEVDGKTKEGIVFDYSNTSLYEH